MNTTGPALTSRRLRPALAAVAVATFLLLAGCASAPSHRPAAADKTAQPAAATAPSTPSLSPEAQQFVSDMQAEFNFDSSVADSDIVSFGQGICASRRLGMSQVSQIRSSRRSWSNTSLSEADSMARLAEKDLCPSYLPRRTVEYIVTGAPADVTYGPAGSDIQGSVPMDVTKPLRHPSYYAIDAQLNGGGSVTCKIKVDGVVISRATASGSYNIASCEIDQNFNGAWENTNNG